jgi:hypothetical protein
VTDEAANMDDWMSGISQLEALAKERLRRHQCAEFERVKLLHQLARYGVCTCHCHFSDSVVHTAAAPCCGNAKTAKTE